MDISGFLPILFFAVIRIMLCKIPQMTALDIDTKERNRKLNFTNFRNAGDPLVTKIVKIKVNQAATPNPPKNRKKLSRQN